MRQGRTEKFEKGKFVTCLSIIERVRLFFNFNISVPTDMKSEAGGLKVIYFVAPFIGKIFALPLLIYRTVYLKIEYGMG